MANSPRDVDDYDAFIGQRLKLRRMALGLSQGALAERLGMSCQQISKYESGTNRISSGRLYQLANLLDVPVSWFFEGLDADDVFDAIRVLEGSMDRDTLQLIFYFAKIDDDTQRKAVLTLVRSMVKSSPKD